MRLAAVQRMGARIPSVTGSPPRRETLVVDGGRLAAASDRRCGGLGEPLPVVFSQRHPLVHRLQPVLR